MKELNFLSLGLAFILIGFLIVFIGSIFTTLRGAGEGKGNIKFSFFGLIGPVPFGFGNDKRLFIFTILIALIFIILFLFFFNRNLH